MILPTPPCSCCALSACTYRTPCGPTCPQCRAESTKSRSRNAVCNRDPLGEVDPGTVKTTRKSNCFCRSNQTIERNGCERGTPYTLVWSSSCCFCTFRVQGTQPQEEYRKVVVDQTTRQSGRALLIEAVKNKHRSSYGQLCHMPQPDKDPHDS